MKKSLIMVTSICVVISILSPLISYTYFEGKLNSNLESYNLNVSMAEQENERLKQEIENLTQKVENPYLTMPFLVTNLGWYVHNSADVINTSRNKFTIYGTVLNVGATTAQNCSLIIHFYRNTTLLQTSEVYIGEIKPWSSSRVGQTIQCSMADSVTRIEVKPKWS